MLDVKQIRKELHLTQEQLAERCGVHWRTVQNWERNPESIPSTATQLLCVMIENNRNTPAVDEQTYYGGEEESVVTLPLIPLDAIAGIPGGDLDGVRFADCERYAVPEFSVRGADFLIRVSGISMYPRYNNGDILACKRLEEVRFIQWGKVYVIDTAQGVLVKHLFPSKNSDCITCHSVNTENYPDFDILKEDIRSFALVVGLIAVE